MKEAHRILAQRAWTFALSLMRVLAAALLLIAGTMLAVRAVGLSIAAPIALAAGAYLLSHVVRALRLVLLSAHPEVPVRSTVLVHFYTAAVSAITPLKLGDILRIAEITALTRSASRALAIYWAERASDAFILVMLCLVMLLVSGATFRAAIPFTASLTMFVLLTVGVLIVLPEHIRRIKIFALRRYSSERAVQVMEVLKGLRAFGEACRSVARDKLSTIVLLSAAIWVLEVFAISQVIGAADAAIAMETLISGLSRMTFSVPAWEGLLFDPQPPPMSSQETLVLGVLIPVGVVAAAIYFQALVRDIWRARALRRTRGANA